jgi:hypothetical protein
MMRDKLAAIEVAKHSVLRPWSTKLNLLKCNNTESMINALVAHQPRIEGLAGLLAIISLTCPSPTERMLQLRSQSRGVFGKLPGVLSGGRPATVSLPRACGALLNVTGWLRDDGRRESKVACGPATTTLRAPCSVISVGSNGEAGFEEGVHTIAPQCTIDVWDGTLDAPKRARVPKYANLKFMDRNFDTKSYQEYAGQRSKISLLKMDCEGCEMTSLPRFIETICTDQVILEVHAYPIFWSHKVAKDGVDFRSHQFDGLAAFFARLGKHYSPFFGEYNPGCPMFRCFEVSYVRRVPCDRDHKLFSRGS